MLLISSTNKISIGDPLQLDGNSLNSHFFFANFQNIGFIMRQKSGSRSKTNTTDKMVT